MAKYIDLTGQRFGRLTVIAKTGKSVRCSVIWECRCDCGKLRFVTTSSLRSGNTRSCGCYASEMSRKRCKNLHTKEVQDKCRYSNGTINGTRVSSLSSRVINKNNKSGVRGVCWDKRKNKWASYITFK